MPHAVVTIDGEPITEAEWRLVLLALFDYRDRSSDPTEQALAADLAGRCGQKSSDYWQRKLGQFAGQNRAPPYDLVKPPSVRQAAPSRTRSKIASPADGD
jgi:hypothetical protein